MRWDDRMEIDEERRRGKENRNLWIWGWRKNNWEGMKMEGKGGLRFKKERR